MGIIFNQEKCTGCGLCISDCFQKIIGLQDGKAYLKDGYCLACGHCVAICPNEAASYTDEAFENYQEKDRITPAQLMDALKGRRSIRSFTNQPVSDEEINTLLDAGRYAPTAGNRQKVRYIIVRDGLDTFREQAMKVLADAADGKYGELPKSVAFYKDTWHKMYQQYKENGTDKLLHGARCMILVVDKSKGSTTSTQLSAGLATANIELMAHALGLGVCYIGFVSSALEYNKELGTALGLKEDEHLTAVMVVGHHNLKYHRLPSRNKADVSFL